jgi:hypothetical protein
MELRSLSVICQFCGVFCYQETPDTSTAYCYVLSVENVIGGSCIGAEQG